jgi:Ca2+/Na+ antiporter
MDAYTVGNLVGRLVLSYLLVWGLMLVFSRVNVRRAFKKANRWYGVGMTLVLFVAGLAASS